jgi:glycosyltransferase involved in cell wall biosynthesis
MVSHTAAAGGSNNVVASLLRLRPAEVQDASVVFLKPGPMMDMPEAPTSLVRAGRFRQVRAHPRTVAALREKIREARADLVFAHVTTAQLYANLAARREGVPYLWWQHESYGHERWLHQLAGRLRAGAVICSADYTADEQRERFPSSPVVRVHPGIRTDGAQSLHDHHATSDVVLGVVGRLQRWKRVELAIHAMPAVLESAPGARLRIVGDVEPGIDDDYPAWLRAEVARLGLADSVALTGHTADGAAAIAELDVLVHCARREPFGLVPLEAMLHGVPPVVPDDGGTRETVRHEVDGVRVDPTDTRALAQAIVTLARDPARRAALGSAGRERVLDYFTEERMAREAWAVAAAVGQGEDPVLALAKARND